MLRLSLSTALAFTLSLNAPAHAQEINGCDVEPADYAELVAPILAGTWTAINGEGFITGPQMNMPLPNAGNDVVEITYSADGTLSASGNDWSDVTVTVLESGAINEGNSAVLLNEFVRDSLLDLSLTYVVDYGCNYADVPIIRMSGSTFVEGELLQFEALTLFASDQLLPGVFWMEFMGHTAQRIILLER